MTTITLRDLDNRDADGAPFETTGTPEEIIGYLDTALRSDLTFDADGTVIDAAIAAVRADDLARANEELRALLVTLAVHLDRSTDA